MSKLNRKFCSFCDKSQEEVRLIDTRSNLIQIENEFYDFSTIFKDILGFDPTNDYTCEDCKDQFVQFFIFKSSIRMPQNPMQFFLSQINDFLSQKDISVNDIKVVRTINSITLQYDEEKPKLKEEDGEYMLVTEDPTTQDINDVFDCKDCGKIEFCGIDLEIHEFLKHTSFGVQLETEIDNCNVVISKLGINSSLYICSVCGSQVENSDILLFHFLEDHCNEIITRINSNLLKDYVNLELIASYLSYMKDCLNGTNQEVTTYLDDRNYFYEMYKASEENEEEIFDQSVQEHSDIDMSEELLVENKKRTDKANELSNEDKEWIRMEISRGKCPTNEKGGKGNIFRCTISKSCNHVSNSSPGLRYHLIMKHLKDRKNLITEERDEVKFSEFFSDSLQSYKTNAAKNSCGECCLKFKDNRSHQLHDKCHELFEIVAQHTYFPICNTCNLKFIDIESLNLHLNKHEMKEDLCEPVRVANGAVKEQGKPLKFSSNNLIVGETTETEFTWKCGHCEGKNFINEAYCNFHMLMNHVTTFCCPIDRMEFSGFKSVSLFIHHLRNKHSELFPNLSFQCTFCHLDFPSIYEKLQHMKNCERKQFQCDHCQKRFFKKTDLASHLKLVTGEVQYECTICFKKCLSGSDLKIHQRSHSKIKPYQCSICTKSFRTLAARANHVESHNANQIYPCELCEKTFKQRQMYRRHMKTMHEQKAA